MQSAAVCMHQARTVCMCCNARCNECALQQCSCASAFQAAHALYTTSAHISSKSGSHIRDELRWQAPLPSTLLPRSLLAAIYAWSAHSDGVRGSMLSSLLPFNMMCSGRRVGAPGASLSGACGRELQRAPGMTPCLA